MARSPRLELADGVYHLLARGNERRAIFLDDRDRHSFLQLLGELRTRFRWRIYAYCLLGNHYHLLAQTPQPNLARGMRHLNGTYAQAFNRRHERVGHLFQGRYTARLIETDEHLLAVTRYIVRNPVVAGLCRWPGEWRWSSHRATLGEAPHWFLDTSGLLSFYGGTLDAARRRYQRHAEADEGEPDVADWHPLVVGSDQFIEQTLARLEPAAGVPRRYFRPPRAPLAKLLAGADHPDALLLAHAQGYSLREIARELGVNASTVSRRLRRARSKSLHATNGT